MTSRDFVYWLQGYLELSESPTMSAAQLEVLKNHLAMVFVHEIDPSMGGEEEQKKLDDAHKGKKDVKDMKKVFNTSPLYRC